MAAVADIVARSSAPKKSTWLNEALFGLRYVRRFCDDLGPGSSVLEVGCGSGILMGLLAEACPALALEGIEPQGDTFHASAELNSQLRRQGLTITKVGFEQFNPGKRFDLIYLVNVFEHLPDWRSFLGFVEHHLKPNGLCLILCPNYGFPYEGHFGLPVIVNKLVTEKAFRKSIQRQERERDVPGLWQSLNFVKLSEVKQEIRGSGLTLTVNNSIINDLIERLATDKEFAKRQWLLGTLGRMSRRIGLVHLICSRPLENFMPYLMLELRRQRQVV